MLAKRLPDLVCRAFADDIAALITDWWAQGPILEATFQEFSGISNLCLNVDKTLCIPLWPSGISDIRSSIASHIPAWEKLDISDKGTYLGFVIGPGKGDESWIKPLAKYSDRVARWANVGGGLQLATLAYNVFALSTLMYVGQLERVPSFVLEREKKLVLKMYPGPGTWLIPEDALFLKETFGLTKSAQPLSMVVRAAQLRVATLGCHFGQTCVTTHSIMNPAYDNIFERWRSLQLCIRESEHFNRYCTWSNWFNNSCCKTLVDNARWCQSKGITVQGLCREIISSSDALQDDSAVDKIKRLFQKHALVAIKGVLVPNAVARLRAKVDRWHGIPYGITGSPGVYSPVILRRLRQLARITTPRIHAAVFRTLFNSWCTHRRFQRRRAGTNRCVFKCGPGAEDSLEHYCRCPIVLRVASSYLHFSYQAEPALDLWCLNSSWLDSDHNLMGISILIYGVYNAFNSIRCSSISDSQQAYLCIVQHCKQGAFGHGACTAFLDSCWRRPISYIC